MIELRLDGLLITALDLTLGAGDNVFSGSIGAWPSGAHTAEVKLIVDSLSATKSCSFAVQDTTPPVAIDNLIARYGAQGTELELVWSAPEDAISQTACKYYHLKAGFEPIAEGNWDVAFPLAVGFMPSEPGTFEQLVVNVPIPGANIFFAIRSEDQSGNLSAVSNSPSHIVASELPATAKIYANSAALVNGDRLLVTCNQDNPGEARRCDLYIAAAVGESLLFYPSWGGDWVCTSVSLPAYSNQEGIVVLDVTVASWIPSGDITFFAAFTEPDSLDVLGEISMVTVRVAP